MGDGGLGGIGNTPLVRLAALTGPEDADVWVKLEASNPTGSYKDRMALAMIEGAERRQALRPGQTVVEYTGGSTGSSLAFVCAIKGYPLKIVSSNAFAAEKLQTMRERRVEALGACDALLLVATDDTRALDTDLVVVGKHDRQSARARSNRLLPCGVLNTVGGVLATPVRLATTRIVQADWIDGTDQKWTPAVQRWLNEKSQVELL